MSATHLCRLFYASTATEHYSPPEIGNILNACRKNNPPLNVTGMLFYGNGYFLQCLEGLREGVNTLYHKILRDKRHKEIELLLFQNISSRCFETWAMKYISANQAATKILQEIGHKNFNPYLLTNYELIAITEAFQNLSHTEPTEKSIPAKTEKTLDVLKLFKPI